MDLKLPVARAWPYRLFVSVTLLAAASAQLLLAPDSALPALLLCAAVLWPALCAWARRWDKPVTALALHLLESTIFAALAVGLSALNAHALLLVILAGAAAVGGWAFLLPSALLMVASCALVGFPQPAAVDLPGLFMAYGVVLSLSLVSFRQAQRLHGQRQRALADSRHLGIVNAHLERYLPPPLRDTLRSGAVRQPPDTCWVIVVFVDLVGFAEFVRHRSAAEVVDVVDAYQTAVDRLASTHGGVLGKFLGDGVLVYFPESDDRAQDAARAVDMICDLPLLLSSLNDRWRQRGQLVGLKARVGVASGYCALGDWGSGQRLDYTLIGDAVNLASRLQAAAGAGSALICEATAALLERSGRFDELVGPARNVCLKGYGDVVAHPLVDAARARH